MQHGAKSTKRFPARPEIGRAASYYQSLDLSGYRWRGYHMAQRLHYFELPGKLSWIAVEDMTWLQPDFLRFVTLGRYDVNWRTVAVYMKARGKWIWPETDLITHS